MTARNAATPAWILTLTLIALRFAAEAVNTHLWDRANYAWSAMALGVIVLFLWPQMAMALRKDKRLLAGKLPILIYLLYLAVRTDPTRLYPIKCLLAEAIVWFFFLFVVDMATTHPAVGGRLKDLILLFVKATVVIGAVQLILFIVENQTLNPADIFSGRPVRSIFVHPSIYLIMTLPFLLPFLRDGKWLWAAILLLTCLATGTRSPFLSLVLLGWVAGRYVFHQAVTGKSYAITILTMLVVYAGVIAWNSGPIEFDYAQADSRFSFGTLQWRIQFWQRLIDETTGLASLFGHGVGSADQLVMDDLLIPPHNDYLRIYYDLGLTGVVLYLAVVVSIWRNAWANESGDRDIVLIVLLMMLSFAITDNFLYVSNRLFLLTFIGSCFAPRTEEPSPPVAAFGRPRQVFARLPVARPPGIRLP
jgi:hypothetical protein